MESGFRSPLIDFFRRGEVARDVRMLAAEGALAPRAHEQLALLIFLADDADPAIAASANATLDALPVEPLQAFLARSDVPDQMRDFFTTRGVSPGGQPSTDVGPLVDSDQSPAVEEEAPADDGPLVLSTLSIVERMKLAMKGSKAQRSQLVRDSNKLVAAAVLSSPKLTESEVETFAKMANVSEETLRTIAMNRSWSKNYGVVAGLARNPKTPVALAMQMVHRLNDKDLKSLMTDRNVQEVVRLTARRIAVKGPKGSE